MRNVTSKEVSMVGGGELVCTVTVGQVNTVSCTGAESSWLTAGQKVFAFLAVNPFTVPGVLVRVSKLRQ